MKTHICKKLKYISDTMNQIATICATMSEKRYSNLSSTIVTYPSDATSSFVSISNSSREKTKLCLNPKSLYMMWNEYKFGVAGVKPAKTFTKGEVQTNLTIIQEEHLLELGGQNGEERLIC